MPRPLPISRLTIWRLAIPMRASFRHAAAERSCAEPMVVSIELADGTVGYGETHPRLYVTGESEDGVLQAIRETFVPELVEIHPAVFGDAIDAAAELPTADASGRVITAARAAVELAVLDAYGRSMERSLEQVAGWLEATDFGTPGSYGHVRYSGVVSASDPRRVPRSIRKMRLFGLRDFKLKVGDDEDDARLRAAIRTLGRRLTDDRVRLRVDANGGWTLRQAVDRLTAWADLPIASVEQPLPRDQVTECSELARRCAFPLMADESLVTADDAEDIFVHRTAALFNIRIAKNGGLIPSLRLALEARRHDLGYQLGCLVGETSILSAAGRWFLQLVPDVRFAEGSYGKFLLRDDVVDRPLRFSWGGRWKPMSGFGLGVEVNPDRLRRLSAKPPVEIVF